MNNVSLVGRLTKDVELRYTSKSNIAVCSMTIAVDRDIRKQGEEKKTDFIPIVVWGKTAEFASKYFAKGHRIGVVGSIQIRTWENDEKGRHYMTEVVADRVYFADGIKNRENEGTESCNNFEEEEGMAEVAEVAEVAEA